MTDTERGIYGDRWIWSCSFLNSCGGCSIYEIRPENPCRSYEPAQDGLCIFWQMQQDMDAAFGATIEADLFADDAFEGGEWEPGGES